MGQAKLVAALRTDLAKGDVLVIVGTGVSIQASGNDPRAGWDGLIRDGIEHCAESSLLSEDEAAALRTKLDENDRDKRLEVAETISNLLKGGDFRRWLRGSVGKLPLLDRELVDAIHALGAPLATTNYDNLLSRDRGIEPVPWTNVEAAIEIIRGDREGILHFHGCYDTPDSVILGRRSYRELLETRGAQALQQAVAATRTLLFIGCGDGLSDPNFGALLDWSAATFGKSIYHHYCLCRKGEAKKLTPQLKFIDYGAKYEDLAPFLRSIAPLALKPPSVPAAGFCFGRKNEVSSLVSALLKKKPSPIPILGGPGMGKTTIALEAMHAKRVAERFGARRWFVRCDGVKTRTELVAAIGRTLGIPITPNLEPQVLAALSDGPGALVIDNAETPLDDDAAPVEELLSVLASVDSLALIVTIRGHHRPAGVAWRATIEAGRLSGKAAREAFVATAGKKEFAADPNLPQLLSVLDGVPLAITLIGRFAQSFPSLDLVWERWKAKRTAMLKDGVGADRLTNVAVSYELSIGVLSPAARRLLSVLAMLPDGVAYVNLPGIFPDPDEAADELRRRAVVIDEESRLRMLAPLREYVATAHPADATDVERAVGHYLALAATEGDKVGAAGGAEAVASLAPEVANMEAMFLRSPGERRAVVASAVYGWGTLMRFTGLGSSFAIEQVMKRALVAGITDLVAECMQTLADIALARSNDDTALRMYEEALPFYEEASDLRGQANCIWSLGNIALRRSDYDSARQRYEQALPLFQKTGSLIGQANCIWSLGNIAFRRSDYDSGRQRYEQALPLYRKADDLSGQANCVSGLGDIAVARSDHDSARQCYEEALPLYREVGNLLGQAVCMLGLGDIALARSNHDSARQCYEEALPLFEKVGDLNGQAGCILGLGEIAPGRSDHDAVSQHCERALALYQKAGDLLGQASCVRRLADIAFRRSDHDSARQLYEKALPLCQQVGSLIGEANCIQGLGDIARDAGETAEAESRYRDALVLYERIPEPYSIGWTHVRLARITASTDARKLHVAAARKAWRSIKGDDHVADLETEFGAE